MNTNPTPAIHLTSAPAAPHPEPAVSDDQVWEQQWARVPHEWRTGDYRLDQAPTNEVFVRNTNYLRSTKTYDFIPHTHQRIRDEAAWWVWTIWDEGTKKIDPAMLTWWGRAITTLASQRAHLTRQDPASMSVTEFNPTIVIREALREFHERNTRYPSPGNMKNLESAAHSIYQHVSVRCTGLPWWAHDTWDMRLDPRIPRRPNEPHRDRTLTLATIEPEWLKEGVRFYLSQMLTLDALTWTSLHSRTTNIGVRLGGYLHHQGITTPTLAPNLEGIRALMGGFLDTLRADGASTKGGPLSANTIAAVRSHVQSFYEFMLDNHTQAAHATSNPAWNDLSADHAILFPPTYTRVRQGNRKQARYYEPDELGTLLAHLPVLATPTTQTITITHQNTTRTYRGLGDPQAARAWEIQALTGRRASEILMLDRDPIRMLPFNGEPDSGPADPDAMVARLTYQQTKVDDVDPTILVPQAVVDIVHEQQTWLSQHHPDSDGPYLFVQPRGNYRGRQARTYRSYTGALKRLNKATNLTNRHGEGLHYTETHRLRHTRATTLLNAGVPVHVVQRYLGHKSPDMTMRYAQTLNETAEAEFLKYKQIGADGRDIDLAPQDIIDLRQFDRRADRILPNGTCLLPPTQSCDKGNACLPCGSCATNITHLPDHQTQRDRIAALIHVRREQFQQRHGAPMPETNVWLQGRLRELASLDAIIARLQQTDTADNAPVKGAGASGKTTPLRLLDSVGADAATQALTDRLDGDPA